jgi:alpha-galactosidase
VKNPVLVLTALVLVLSAGCRTSRTAASSAPPNGPARIDIHGGKIRIEYAGRGIFEAEIGMAEGRGTVRSAIDVFISENRIDQVIRFSGDRQGEAVRLAGTITGSGESFPVEADRPRTGPLIVRHSSGLSRSRLNRAVYDRGRDWILSVDANPAVSIAVLGDGAGARTFSLAAEGPEIILRFRPRYFQKHRGLEFFEPWTYRVWPASVAGWSSWFAYLDRVTEKDIVETADALSEVLLPFGYEILQIDDGYQRGEGLPDLWLNTNAKFPHGLEYLSRYIKSKGLTPGIWTNVAFKQKEYAEAHKEWFVTDGEKRLHAGNWINLSLDGSNPAALSAVVRPVYRALRGSGWEYFKVDALRHLRYEGYNSGADYFRRRHADPVEAFRSYAAAIRDEIGRDHFMLGCWGIRPELVGLIDGCRIGDDGFSYAGLAQYNSFNNVIWRNDPDHVELDEDAHRSTMVTSLTGSALLLTDKPSVYRTEAVETAKRASPVLWTYPGQIYDVDPSRSDNLWKVGSEISGSGPRIFDAGNMPRCDLYLLEVNRPFENWCVLGRTGESVQSISFMDLGLDAAKEYYVFEFWSKKLLGGFIGSFIPGPLDPVLKCQDLCIKERLPRPQLLATSRHVSCGGVDLLDLSWNNRVLAGTSRVVRGDTYELFITEPPGFRLAGFDGGAAGVAKVERADGFLRVILNPDSSLETSWTATFAPVQDDRSNHK